MGKPIRFEGMKPPPANQAQSELEVDGVRLDLHQKMRMVGLTFGVEPTTATLGWAAMEEMIVVRKGQALPISGMAMHFSELTRFEVAFQAEPPGALDFFELRSESPKSEMSLRFFFEGGTLRISCGVCRAELVGALEDDDDPGTEPNSTEGPALIQ